MHAVGTEGAGQPKSIALCSTATSYVDEIAGGHIQGKPLSAIEEQGYLDFMGVAMGPAMVEDAGRTDPYGMACGYRGKVLAIHGTKDFIPVDYIRRYEDVYGENMQLKVIEDGDHGFGNVKHREMVMPLSVILWQSRQVCKAGRLCAVSDFLSVHGKNNLRPVVL